MRCRCRHLLRSRWIRNARHLALSRANLSLMAVADAMVCLDPSVVTLELQKSDTRRGKQICARDQYGGLFNP